MKGQNTGKALDLQVIEKNVVLDRQASRVSTNATNKIAECTVGDESGVIVFVAKNEQGDTLSPLAKRD